ncbi:MAG: methylenetetrahydrofolate reductase [NAD(P)H] [Chlorobi bacterium]|nr:methylenetetrahydrofolate reductase [NAD(P)H] [Chlorobiota bacterium]
MRLVDKLKNTKKTYFSFEILPPMKGGSMEDIYNVIDPLMEFEPMNINVTYHQQEVVYKKNKLGVIERKTIRKRPGTVAISAAIKYHYKKPIVVPHLICGGFTKDETENALIDLNFLGMTNILVLRGDPPANQKYFKAVKNGHEHTTGLIKQIMHMNEGRYCDEDLHNIRKTNFSVGVAGYPEKHNEAPNMKSDIKYLKMKVDAGADYVVTQMFFDNQKYFDFVKLCRKEGINVPIVPGIKPIRTKRDLELLPQVFNIDIPEELANEIENAKDNKAVNRIGIEWTIQQSKELIKNGVPSVHYYTIGKSDNIKEIAKAVF